MAENNSLKAYLSETSQMPSTAINIKALKPQGMMSMVDAIVQSNQQFSSNVVESILHLMTVTTGKMNKLLKALILVPKSIAELIPKQMASQQRNDPTVKSDLAQAESDREQKKAQKADSPWGLLKDILQAIKEERRGKLGVGATILGLGGLSGFLTGAVIGKFISSIKFISHLIEFIIPAKVTKFFTGLKTGWVAKIGELFKAAKSAIKVKFVKWLEPLGKILGKESKLGKAFGMIGRVIAWVTTKFFPSFLKFGAHFGGFLGKFGKIFLKAAKFGGKILGPIGWLIDIVMGVVAAVKEYMAGGSIKDILIAFFAGFANSLTFGLLKTDKLKEWFGDFVNWIVKAGMWTWENVIQPAWEGIKVIFQALWDSAVWTWENVIQPAWSMARIVFEKVSEFFSWAWDGIKSVWDSLVFVFEDIGRLFSKGEESIILKTLKTTFFDFIDNMKGMLSGAVGKLNDVFKSVARWIIGMIPLGLEKYLPEPLREWSGYDKQENIKKQDTVIDSSVDEYIEFKEKRGTHFTPEQKKMLHQKAKEGSLREHILENITTIDDDVNQDFAKTKSRFGLLDTVAQSTPRLELSDGANLHLPASVITNTEATTRNAEASSMNNNGINTTNVVDNRNVTSVQTTDNNMFGTEAIDTTQGARRSRIPGDFSRK